MATHFFLADSKYMDENEIAAAKRFDESALICQRSGGLLTGAVFTLEIPDACLDGLSRDAQVVNNNNVLEINTVGHLVDAIRETTSRVITLDTVNKNRQKYQLPSRSRVEEYAGRIKKRATSFN